MEFGLLGPLMVRSGGTELPVPRGRARALLAALLLQADRVVHSDAITQVLWAGEPPLSAPVVIRHYVWQLRQALSQAGPQRIATQPGGYLIRVADSELDLSRFEELIASARAAAASQSWPHAAEQAGTALALWRGEPLADVESELLALREVPRLAELRLQASEARLDAILHLGEHAEATAELTRLAAAHPLREHVHALLMLALYRSGRQADALAAYRQLRARLVEELGAEPGAELQKLHRQVLAADPALHLPQSVIAANGTSPGEAEVSARGPMPAVPRQLPTAVTHFTGRAAELQTLTRMLDQAAGTPGTVVISAIGGTAGVGKTALALHWAHQVASRFPDGQLYVNLRGFDPGGAPATPAEAIRGFLAGLGMPPERVPPSPGALPGLYRSLLAQRRMLVLLDNAADEPQVRPLLPASPGTLVIITSRRQLTGLAAADNAQLLSLGVLSHDEATRMLAARLGSERTDAEPDAVAEIARLCACLPLALAVAAARAAARPGFPLAGLADELRDANARLDALDAGDPSSSVSAVFSWSYRQLTPESARMMRLLGLHPGPDISVPAAASLSGRSPAQARQMLGELARAHLIAEHAPGRYAFHDLLRAYAAGRSDAEDGEPERRAAKGRLLDHYLHAGHAAALLLYALRDPIPLDPPLAGVTVEELAGYEQALAWFSTEHDVLLATVTLAADDGFDVHAWQIPWTMADFLALRGHWDQRIAIQRTAVTAATHLGDAAGHALSLRLLALACSSAGDYDESLTHFAGCLVLYQQLGDSVGEARSHQSLAVVAERQGRYHDALRHAEQALSLFQAIGHQAGQADALNNAGWCHALVGDFSQARTFCQEALRLHRKMGNRRDEAYAWDSLGYAEHQLGHLAEAAACYQRAVDIFAENSDRFYLADTLTHLGDAHRDAGEPQRAAAAWQQALSILDSLKHQHAEQVRARLAAVNH